MLEHTGAHHTKARTGLSSLSRSQSKNRELQAEYVDNEPQIHGQGIAATPTQFYLFLRGQTEVECPYTVTINFAETSVSAVILVLRLPFDG